MIVTKPIDLSISSELSITVLIHVKMDDLGERIRNVRKKHCKNNKISLISICKASGIMSRQHWNKIESSQKNLPYETLLKIEKALNYDFGVSRKIEEETIKKTIQEISLR